ncbi:MAG: phosphotransferase [Gammaproteobacteria bacterium]|nr:phosphotransferase [Gammaproteobacteria bacterium]
MSERSTQLNNWLNQLGYRDYRLNPASEDASFRAYLRLQTADESFIVMDAPPEKEPCDQFIAVADKLRAAGLNAPEIIARNLDHGFLVLTDFGSSDYLSQLGPETEASLYGDALAALLLMQTRIDADDLPPYDTALLQREMDLFHDWFLGKLMGITLDQAQQAAWQSIKQALVDNALAQPQVFVHRDYHSRNLMKTDKKNPGILDFQDAVKGPITYDLVSLLRDCYIAWPATRIDQLAVEYYEFARASQLVDVEAEQFIRWFNLMGIQRHLKAIGIFSRLKIRDGKDGYLRDIPRTLEYLRQISAGEMTMAGLFSMIEQLRLGARVAALAAG